MPLFDNQNLYGNNFDNQQLNLNQFIGGNNQNTEMNYLNKPIDSANNDLMKVVESSKVSLQFRYSDFPTYRLTRAWENMDFLETESPYLN